MATSRRGADGIDVRSQPIEDELVAIRERLNAIETIQSISNAPTVRKYVEEHLTTDRALEIMRACESARSKADLTEEFAFKSAQALDHHLKPLREADLLRQVVGDDGVVRFEWSNLFRRLPRSTINAITSMKKARPPKSKHG
jgi:hypothetical protein